MKTCKDCEYFNGYDHSDGTPYCDYDGGYECCPYNCTGRINEDEFKIILDMPEISTFIQHTIQNTVESSVYKMIAGQVKSIVSDKIKDSAEAYVEESLKKAVDDEIKTYMEKDITIGGGWYEPNRTMSRNEYLAECVSTTLDKKLESEQIKKIVTDYCSREITSKVDALKDDVNRGIKNTFDAETRKALSDNVVTVLMAGDTYQRLSDSMGRLLK